MAAVSPELAEEENKLSTEGEALKLLLAIKDEAMNDPELKKFLESVYGSADMVDENLDLVEERTKTFFANVIKRYYAVNGINIEKTSMGTLTRLSDMMTRYFKEKNPRGHWWRDLWAQSGEKRGNLASNLDHQAGFWGVSMEPMKMSETGGAGEIQIALGQIMLEVAKNQSLYATKEIPYLDLDGFEDRGRYRNDGSEFLRKALNGDYPELKGVTPLTANTLEYNPFYLIHKKKLKYREIGEASGNVIERMKVRVYLEDKKNNKLYYKDVPAMEIMKMPPADLEMTMVGGRKDIYPAEKWQELPDYPDYDEEAPIIGISISGAPTPDSKLYRHSRSGQSTMCLNYDTDRGRLDMAFCHANFDGVQGIDWALAVAQALEIKSKGRTRGLEINWCPPTQVLRHSLNGWGIEAALSKFKENDTMYLDEPKVMKMVSSWGLSDVQMNNELTTDEYQDIKDVVEAINERFYDRYKDKLVEIIKEKGLNPDEKTMKYFLNRLGLSKMTTNKYIDMMGRQFYGPVASCAATRESETRLGYLQVMMMKDINGVIQSYGMEYKGELRNDVFEGVGDELLFEELERSVNSMMEEYANYALLDFSSLNAIKCETADFRSMTEVFTEIFESGALEGALIQFMTSHVGSIRKLGGNKEELAALELFWSALTSMEEERFCRAYSDGTVLRDGKETIRYGFRERLTTRMVEEFNLYENVRLTREDGAIDRVATELSRGNLIERERIKALAEYALKEFNAYCFYDHEIWGKRNERPQSLKYIGEMLRDTCGMMGFGKPDKELFEGVQYLLMAGMLDRDQCFMKMCVKSAREVKQRLVAK